MTKSEPVITSRSLLDFLVSQRRLVAMLVVCGCVMVTPNWLRHRESARAHESHQYLESVRVAQARYVEAHGHFADHISELDLDRPEPTFFSIGDIKPGRTGSLSSSWSLTLTRFGDTHLYGPYTVTFTEQGFDSGESTIDPMICAMNEKQRKLANTEYH